MRAPAVRISTDKFLPPIYTPQAKFADLARLRFGENDCYHVVLLRKTLVPQGGFEPPTY